MTTARPQVPPEFIAAHKRRRMIDAMAELCAEQGYEATKIADIVSRAGVARKTLYDNFDGKEDLFLSAFAFYYKGALAAVEGACDGTGGGWQQRLHRLDESELIGFVAYPEEAPVKAPSA